MADETNKDGAPNGTSDESAKEPETVQGAIAYDVTVYVNRVEEDRIKLLGIPDNTELLIVDLGKLETLPAGKRFRLTLTEIV